MPSIGRSGIWLWLLVLVVGGGARTFDDGIQLSPASCPSWDAQDEGSPVGPAHLPEAMSTTAPLPGTRLLDPAPPECRANGLGNDLPALRDPADRDPFSARPPPR